MLETAKALGSLVMVHWACTSFKTINKHVTLIVTLALKKSVNCGCEKLSQSSGQQRLID